MVQRYWIFMFLAGLVILSGSGRPAAAVDFNAEIGTSWSYSYATQHGSHGFFGPYNVDNSTTGSDFAPLNGWLGGTMVSGSDTGFSQLTTLIEATLAINEAVEMKAWYGVGPYRTDTRPGPENPISFGNWRLWRVAAMTPLGRFYYGKTFFGTPKSIQYYDDRHTEEFFMLQQFYEVYLSPEEKEKEKAADTTEREVEELIQEATDDVPREATDDVPQEPTEEETEEQGVYERGYRTLYSGHDWAPSMQVWLGFYPWRRGRTNYPRPLHRDVSYWNEADFNAARAINLMGYVEYGSAFWTAALLSIWSRYREGPESQETAARRKAFPSADTEIFEGSLSFEFNNGPFQVDTEIAWYYRTIRFQRSLDGTFNGVADNVDGSGSLFAPNYIESWRFKFECGAVFGPLAIRLFYGRMPGPDRRHGVLIDRQPLIQETEYGATGLYGQYSNILANSFSGGVGGFGDIAGADSYGIKLDYMLASNLILYGSFLTARRISHGYGWGFVRPTTPADTAAAAARGEEPPPGFGTVSYGVRGTFWDPAPAIPDNDLGWEIDTGLTWKLLENWTLYVNVGFWKPGRWFRYACIDKSVPNWDDPSSANNFGINPDRTISPVSTVVITVRAEL